MTPAPRRVLVVEDESSQRLMYQRALGQMEFESVCTGTVEQAQRELAAGAFSIALLDLNLGADDGLGVFEFIREHYPAVSVVIATGYGTFEIAKRAIKMDVVDFLSKPVSLADLEAAISKAWSRHVFVQSPVDEIRAADTTGLFADDTPLPITDLESLNIEHVEKTLIMEALRRCNDSRKDAAKMLGISERKLYYRLTQYRSR